MAAPLLGDCIIGQGYCLVETTQSNIKDLSSLPDVLWSGKSPAGNSNRESLDLDTWSDVYLKTSEKKG